MTTKDTLQIKFDGILESATIRSNEVLEDSLGVIRREKIQYNDNVLEELESNLAQKHSEYNSGFYEIHDLLKMKSKLMQDALIDLYPADEVRHPSQILTSS